MKKTLLTVLTLILTITLGSQIAKAIGSLTPSGTAGDATQYTLNDIYTRLTTNNSTSTKSGTITSPSSIAASFNTLTEIYNAIPTIDAAKVATGTIYLGVTGTLATSTPELQWSADQGQINYAAAVAACTALGTGWRLPTIRELLAKISDELFLPQPGIFPNTGMYFWSSSENSFNRVETGYFDGSVENWDQEKTSVITHTYCVR